MANMDSSTTFGQRSRLWMLVGYVAALVVVSRVALGSWFPPFTQQGLWFYSGLSAIVLGSLLLTPYFSKPADTISYVVAGLLGLLSVNPWRVEPSNQFDCTLWSIVVAFQALLLGIGLLAIALKDSPSEVWHKVSRSFYYISATLGTPRIVFSSIFFFAIFVFHRSTRREYLTISAAWILLIALQPLEFVASLAKRLWGIWSQTQTTIQYGTVVGQQFPNVVLVQETHPGFSDEDELLLVQGSDGNPSLAMKLDQVGFAGGVWRRTFQLSVPIKAYADHVDPLTLASIRQGAVFHLNADILADPLAADPLWQHRNRLIGIVAPSTNLTHLEVEIIRCDVELQEGRLLEVLINSRPVFFQVIDGLTQEEIIQQKNTRGFVLARGRKIGYWNAETKRLQTASWVPQPNAPVYLAESMQATLDRDAVGCFPNTAHHVTVDPDLLVTHNAAVLGILGSGKSYLVLELAERVIKKGIKVVCLDMTNQYSTGLSPFYNSQELQAEIDGLRAIGAQGKTNVKQNVEEGGSVAQFRARLKAIMSAFLQPMQTTNMIKILNPAQLEVWRQDSKPFSGNASMASLTVVEVTRVITEVCLEVLQEQGITDTARCCVVFEEAHSLVPEWNSVAAEGDRTACNGTSKAILQGRKFGLGCIAVTQRTANITKSILNQCNTVFALRTYDATGVEFLKHYIGDDFARVLSVLEDRHCVIFGRASSCKDPAVVRLNERSDLLQILRPQQIEE
jgi:hypothetical protein